MGILRGWKFDGLWRLGKMRAQDGAMWDVQVLMRHLANVPRQEKAVLMRQISQVRCSTLIFEIRVSSSLPFKNKYIFDSDLPW